TIGCQFSPEGMIIRNQLAERTVNYIQNIPDMSAYEMGYDLGFGTEKALEIALTRRVMPFSKTALGVRNVGNASRFSTIQSVNTYGKWGSFNQRKFTWPTGRGIGVGQLQHVQRR